MEVYIFEKVNYITILCLLQQRWSSPKLPPNIPNYIQPIESDWLQTSPVECKPLRVGCPSLFRFAFDLHTFNHRWRRDCFCLPYFSCCGLATVYLSVWNWLPSEPFRLSWLSQDSDPARSQNHIGGCSGERPYSNWFYSIAELCSLTHSGVSPRQSGSLDGRFCERGYQLWCWITGPISQRGQYWR